jgi:hypothetical protein
MRRERVEIATVGFDDYAILAPDPFGVPLRTGIRLPALAGVRYRILAATCDLNAGDAITHLRQFLEVGSPEATGDDDTFPVYPFVLQVTSSTWRFIDGNTTWTLTLDKNVAVRNTHGPWDQPSFNYDDGGTSTLLYRTANFLTPKTAPGYLGVSSYTPPPMRGTVARVWRDIRNPWDRINRHEFRIPIVRPTRARVYVDVLQTSTETRETPTLGAQTNPYNVTGLRPEDNALLMFPDTLRYWAAGAALGVERAQPRLARGGRFDE